MKILVSGQHMEVGESFRSYIEDSIMKNVVKYFDNPTTANVKVTKEKQHYIRSDIIINQGTGTGVIIRSSAHDGDAYKSFDQALEKAETQLRKYKTRLKSHHHNKEDRLAHLNGIKYVISPNVSEESEEDAPLIIAEKAAVVEKLSVGDAVMQLDLMDVPALMFINRSSGRFNIVYYRKDGNISWVDLPKNV